MNLMRKMTEEGIEHRDCYECSLKYCQPDCFNKHPGSMIALGKMMSEVQDKKGVKVHIAGRTQH